MYCTNCGKQLREGSRFCSFCGVRVEGILPAVSPSPNPAPAYADHPYKRLGGWLAVFAYAQIVVTILTSISLFIAVILALPYLSMVGARYIFFLVIGLASFAVTVYVCIRLFRMIRNRNVLFLRFYELWLMIELVCATICIVFRLGGVADNISTLVSSGIGFVFWEIYFLRSERVRIYFGSDEYIRRSLIASGLGNRGN